MSRPANTQRNFHNYAQAAAAQPTQPRRTSTSGATYTRAQQSFNAAGPTSQQPSAGTAVAQNGSSEGKVRPQSGANNIAARSAAKASAVQLPAPPTGAGNLGRIQFGTTSATSGSPPITSSTPLVGTAMSGGKPPSVPPKNSATFGSTGRDESAATGNRPPTTGRFQDSARPQSAPVRQPSGPPPVHHEPARRRKDSVSSTVSNEGSQQWPQGGQYHNHYNYYRKGSGGYGQSRPRDKTPSSIPPSPHITPVQSSGGPVPIQVPVQPAQVPQGWSSYPPRGGVIFDPTMYAASFGYTAVQGMPQPYLPSYGPTVRTMPNVQPHIQSQQAVYVTPQKSSRAVPIIDPSTKSEVPIKSVQTPVKASSTRKDETPPTREAKKPDDADKAKDNSKTEKESKAVPIVNPADKDKEERERREKDNERHREEQEREEKERREREEQERKEREERERKEREEREEQVRRERERIEREERERKEREEREREERERKEREEREREERERKEREEREREEREREERERKEREEREREEREREERERKEREERERKEREERERKEREERERKEREERERKEREERERKEREAQEQKEREEREQREREERERKEREEQREREEREERERKEREEQREREEKERREHEEKERKEREERERLEEQTEEERLENERKQKDSDVKSKADTEEADKQNLTSSDKKDSKKYGKGNRPGPLDLSRTNSSNQIESAPLSALGSARKIEDLNAVPYPEFVKSPNPALNQNAQPGKYKYDRDFLLQFMTYCKEKPENLPQLDVVGIADQEERRKRPGGGGGGGGGSRSQPKNSPSQSAYPTMGDFKYAGGKTSEDRFYASYSRSGAQKFGSAALGPRSSSGNQKLPPLHAAPSSPGRSASTGGRQEQKRPKRGQHQAETSLQSNADSQSADKKKDPDVKLLVSENRWVPASAAARKKAKGGSGSEELEAVHRKAKGLLNKLTLEKFDAISDKIIELANDSKNELDGRTLKAVIQLTFEKACDEANWSSMYAQLCRKMIHNIDQEISDENVVNAKGEPVRGTLLFRKYLLNRCQEEFERGWKENIPVPENEEGEPDVLSDEYYIVVKAKRRGLGLIKFIGELFKLQMLTERIMHECIKKLCNNMSEPEEEETESLCKLMATVGRELDHESARQHMDVYFSRMETMGRNEKLSARIRFMIMDIIELRQRNWVPRRQDNAPKTLQEIHDEAAKEKEEAEALRRSTSSGGRIPTRSEQMSRGGSGRRSDKGSHHGPGGSVQNDGGWTMVSSSQSSRNKAGDLSKFGSVNRATKTGPALALAPGGSSQFPSLAGGSKGWASGSKEREEKGTGMTRAHSTSNMYGVLANDHGDGRKSTESQDPSQTGRPKLKLLPRGSTTGEIQKRSDNDQEIQSKDATGKVESDKPGSRNNEAVDRAEHDLVMNDNDGSKQSVRKSSRRRAGSAGVEADESSDHDDGKSMDKPSNHGDLPVEGGPSSKPNNDDSGGRGQPGDKVDGS